MREIIYQFITWVARVHEHIIGINDSGGWYFNDKQLHFIVVGLFGMALIFVLYPIFKLLANTGHTMVITWLYVFTVVIVLCFAIEIGQWYSGTGVMESEDIAYGITGFLVMFFIFAVIRGIYHGIKSLLKKDYEREAARHVFSEPGDNRGRYTVFAEDPDEVKYDDALRMYQRMRSSGSGGQSSSYGAQSGSRQSSKNGGNADGDRSGSYGMPDDNGY